MNAERALAVDVLSLFPNVFSGFVAESMLARAIQCGILRVTSRSIREWTTDRHAVADDRPFGGGAGMVLKPEPIALALKDLKTSGTSTIYLCPDGELFSSEIARELAKSRHLILLCGHYEGVDERIREKYVDREISIGDYVLTNGILAAAVVIDAVARYVPGVLGAEQSLEQDSFSDGLLTFPQYTRPEIFDGSSVPEILLSGHHKKITQWRHEQRMLRTQRRRPDLWKRFLSSAKSPSKSSVLDAQP
ncbi:MAG: tRNA (guanosine(37)-N1)-methyltransferase TrmD [Puniceicoccales bacterium]|jgi:tRNA (guanine37-N1)-methyltransferase|nr:tRNA (guanosine(37)-N1)-methyltransferase TrmD [Puniceicoccales bacterium]